MQKLVFVFILLVILLQGCKQEDGKKYICPPCDQSCDLEIYDKGGACPVCGMELVEKRTYNKALTNIQVRQDIDVLITTFKNNHPGFYDYQSESDFAQT